MPIRRTIAAIIAAATTATLLSTSPATAANAATPELVTATSPCKDVIVIGARGSGESATDDLGLGAEVKTGLDAYSQEMGGYAVGYYAVPYTAAPATLDLVTSDKYRKKFFASIDDGVTKTLEFLSQREPACRNTGERYVLIGYSQGAMVMHRILWQLAQGRTKSTDLATHLLPRLDGILAVADGDHIPNEGGNHYGSAPAGSWGVWWQAVDARDFGSTKSSKYQPVRAVIPTVPGWDPTRFYSVCQEGDVICHSDSGWAPPIAIDVHGTSYKDPGASTQWSRIAAWNIADYTKAAKPLPVDPNPIPSGNVPVRVGQRGSKILADDGWYVSSVQWLTEPIPGAVLDSGMATTPATLTYTPTAPGTYPFGVRVTATDGTTTDINGAFVAYPVPEPSLAVTNLATRYDTTTYSFPAVMVDFDIIRTAASDSTPGRYFTTREAGADDGFNYAGGDINSNGKLDAGETWHYAGMAPWYETTNTLTRTILVYANDTTGAGAWRETTATFTATR